MKVHLTTALLITLLGYLTIWKNWYDDTIFIVILISLSWVTMFFHFYLKRYFFQGTLILFTLSSGFYGFCEYSYGTYNHSILNSVYSTIRLFFLDVDPVFNQGADKYAELPLPVEFARWTAALYTISTIGLFMLNYLGVSLKGESYRWLGSHIIIVGYNEKSSVFIKNMLEEKHKVSLVTRSLADEDRRELYKLGVPVFMDETKDIAELLVKSGAAKANNLVLFDEDFVNLETYISIKNNLRPKKQLRVAIHLEHPKSLQVYERMILEENRLIKSYTFSSSQLIAEKMLLEHPLYEGYENQLRKLDGDSLHILFIGFGTRNQQIAFHALNLCHFLTNKKMKFTVYDRNIEKVKKEWSYLARKADDLAVIEYNKIDLVDQDLTGELANIKEPITHVFLSLQDDFLDMVEGLELIEPLPNVPVFIKMRENHKVSNWLHQNEEEYKQVKRYANLNEVLNTDYVLNKKLNQAAETVHQKYQELRKAKKLKPDKDWNELTVFKQESNRYQMLHSDTKLMLLGLKKSEKETGTRIGIALNEESFAAYITPLKESLAKIEHNRWNAFHYLRGWETAPAETTLSKEELERLKLHKSLVTWETLSEDTKEFDRDTIKQLLLYYEAQGYELITEEGTIERIA